MGLNLSEIASDMLGAAVNEAAGQWNKIKGVAASEIKQLARNIVDAAKAVAAGALKPTTGRVVLTQSKNLTISLIAALTALAAAAVKKIIMAAVNVVKAAVNAAAGFVIL